MIESLGYFTLWGAAGFQHKTAHRKPKPLNLSILPLVGVLIHSLSFGVWHLASIRVPMPLGIGIYLLLLTMLTGPMIWSKVPNACAALFTDTSGGLAKQLLGPSKSHRLRPLGIPFLLMILGSKGVALFYLLGQESQTLLLQVISVGAIARLSVLQTLTFNDPISRPRNFVLSIKDPDRVSGIAMAGVGSLALGLMGWKLGLLGLGMAWIVAAALSKIAQRKHGGVSLGILGLSSELVEVGLLFVLAIS